MEIEVVPRRERHTRPEGLHFHVIPGERSDHSALQDFNSREVVLRKRGAAQEVVLNSNLIREPKMS
jgi:hypothetical protein